MMQNKYALRIETQEEPFVDVYYMGDIYIGHFNKLTGEVFKADCYFVMIPIPSEEKTDAVSAYALVAGALERRGEDWKQMFLYE